MDAPRAPAPDAASASARKPAPAPSASSARPAAALPLLPLSDAYAHVNTLDELDALVRACTACGLAPTRKNTVFSRGKGTSGLCFVGEGPGADEDEQGEPFVGKAGQLLDQMIQAMGLSRDDVYVCNIVKCRPPDNRKPLPEEMAACRPFLQRQLEILKPEVIVALGATAVTGLIGTTDGITRIRGKWLLYRGETAVMPTVHPAYLLRTPSAKRDVWTDLKEVIRHMGRTLPGKA